MAVQLFLLPKFLLHCCRCAAEPGAAAQPCGTGREKPYAAKFGCLLFRDAPNGSPAATRASSLCRNFREKGIDVSGWFLPCVYFIPPVLAGATLTF